MKALPLIALLIGSIAVLPAQSWSDWEISDQPIQNGVNCESHLLSDGSLLVLHEDEVDLGVEVQRLLTLQTFKDGTFTSQPIMYVGTTDVTTDAHQIRLIGNGRVCWAIWRTENSAGENSLKALQVAPFTGSITPETVSSESSWWEFDACLGHDDLPRVAFISHDLKTGWLSRRTPMGGWESAARFLTPPSTILHDIAIASRDMQLDVFLCVGTNLSGAGLGSGFSSGLYRYYGPETENWSALAFPNTQTWDTASFPTSNDPVAFDLRAQWTPDGRIAATYANFSDRTAYLATWKDGVLERDNYFTGAATRVRETNLACASDGRILVTYRDATAPAIRIWKAGTFGAPIMVSEMDGLREFDIELQANDFPWISGCEPQTFPAPNLRVGTPIENTDLDHDGFIRFLEEAFHMNPSAPDADQGPIFSVAKVGGEDYLTLSYLSDSGGSGGNPYLTADYVYQVEVSTDGITWSTDPSRVILADRFTITGRGTVSTVRSTQPIGSLAHEFMRVRVSYP